MEVRIIAVVRGCRHKLDDEVRDDDDRSDSWVGRCDG